NLATVGQGEVWQAAELFDSAEDVIPPARVQPGAVVAQFVQNLVHLESGQDGFNEHVGANGAARDIKGILPEVEDVIPQPRFQVAFQLGQIEIWPAASLDQFDGVMEVEQPEIEEAGGNRFAIDQDVLFFQVPAARPHHERGDLVVQKVLFPVEAGM